MRLRTLRGCHLFSGCLIQPDFSYTSWEPPSSFNGGSEQLLTRFWERVGDGRDMNDPSLFKTGEEVLPKGPPRVSHWLVVLTTSSHAFQQENLRTRK